VLRTIEEDKNMVEDDARRLMRAINELQANDRVGVLVRIDNAVTYRAGIGPDFYPESPRCDAAVAHLVNQGALVREEGLDAAAIIGQAYGFVGQAYGFFKITQTGIDMAKS
jgi:hypothetical protein